MLNTLKRWLSPPVFEDDEKNRVAQVFNSVLLVFIALLFVAAVGFFIANRADILRFTILAIFLIVSLIAYVLLHLKYITPASYVFLIGLGISFALYLITIGGVRLPVMTLFVSLLIMAGLLLGQRGVLIFMGLSLISIGLSLYAELNGLQRIPYEQASGGPIQAFIAHTVILVLSGAFIIILVQGSTNALAKARQNEQDLAQTNRELKDIQLHLEDRVSARAQRLEAAATISEHLNTIKELEPLLNAAVNQTARIFGYYHTHIYLLDESNQNLVVAAGTGPAGAEMKTRGHSIKVNAATSLVARSARNREVVKVDNVRQAPDWLPNPLLPDTFAEIAVPIIFQDEVLGVLDAQQNEVGAFDDIEANLLRFLSSQIGVAIYNARLHQQTQQALKDVEGLSRQLSKQVWQKIDELVDASGYTYTRGGIRPADQDWLTEMKQAIQQKNLIKNEQNGSETTALAIPLTLRGEVIGVIGIERGAATAWTDDELATIEAVTDQIALALDAARLSRETERSAWHDRVVSEATSKVWSQAEVEAVMKTAITQLGIDLNASEVVIRLGTQAEFELE